jgi:hypothetical protein
MQAALDEGVDVLGLARPVCVDQRCAKALMAGQTERLPSWENNLKRAKGLFSSNSPIPMLGVLSNFAGIFWFYAQLNRLAKGRAADVKLWPPRAMVEVMMSGNAILARRHRWLNASAATSEAPSPERLARALRKNAA